jgi:hypothetical protein
VHRYAQRRRANDRDRLADRTEVDAGLGPRAGSAVELASLVRQADGGARRRLADAVQSRSGNAALASMLGGGTRIHGLPAHVRAGTASDVIDSIVGGVSTAMGLGDELGEALELGEDEAEELPVPTKSGTSIVVNDTTFAVPGPFTTMATTLAARPEAGSVTAEISDIYLFPTSGKVTLASITVTETRSLPTWTDRGDPSPPQVAEWERFRTALAVHEQTHIDIDKKVFADVHKKALGVSYEKANERIDEVDAAATAANKEFDDATEHGKKAGTEINTNVDGGTTKVP